MFIAEINVMPLKELLDPQGKAVEHGLHNMGYNGMEQVRIGKHVTIKINVTSKAEAERQVEEACKKLLHNPVMEYYEFTIHEG
jgi:phosphoribosylformylglycinamidine synthase subunit PurS